MINATGTSKNFKRERILVSCPLEINQCSSSLKSKKSRVEPIILPKHSPSDQTCAHSPDTSQSKNILRASSSALTLDDLVCMAVLVRSQSKGNSVPDHDLVAHDVYKSYEEAGKGMREFCINIFPQITSDPRAELSSSDARTFENALLNNNDGPLQETRQQTPKGNPTPVKTNELHILPFVERTGIEHIHLEKFGISLSCASGGESIRPSPSKNCKGDLSSIDEMLKKSIHRELLKKEIIFHNIHALRLLRHNL